MTIQPFSSMERALLALLERDFTYGAEALSDHPERVGGDFGYEGKPWFIRIDQVPGGASNRLEGDFVLDIEVFSPSYSTAESVAFAVEALLLGYPHVVEVGGRKVVFDSVTENQGPSDIPWEGDDKVTRLLATYVITARRR